MRTTSESSPQPPVAAGDLEWARIRSFLHADSPPLALIEVESAAQAEDVAAAIRAAAGGPVVVFRVASPADTRKLLGWLEAEGGKADPGAVFLLVATERSQVTGDESEAFWKWMNAHRERFRPPAGRLAFVLTPPLVDAFARYADHLWDWVSLKFSLLRLGTGDRFAQMDRTPVAGLRGGRAPGEAARLLPALREQLASARRAGLPESVIRREHAWPLFRALGDAGHLRDAADLLETDLSGDFASELPVTERIEWLGDLGFFHLNRWELTAAEDALQQVLSLAEDRPDTLAWVYHGLGRIAEERRDFSSAEQWYQKSLAIAEKQGDEHGAASTYGQLGILAGLQERCIESGQWFIRAAQAYAATNDTEGAERQSGNFLVTWDRADDAERAQLEAMWEQAGLGELPKDDAPSHSAGEGLE